MAQDNLSFSWELKGNVAEQIQKAVQNAEDLQAALKKATQEGDLKTYEKYGDNVAKNIKEAEKALYKLMDAREKADKALGREKANLFDTSKLQEALGRLDAIINSVMNIGDAAARSKTAVKDMLSSMSADVVLKSVKGGTSSLNKDIDKNLREESKARDKAAKEAKRAEEEAKAAAERNTKAQEKVKDALAKIATARANLSAASEKGNQQEIAHAQMLMRFLDNLSSKLNALKGTWLGEKGALTGILGSGYQGLMRNVSQAVSDIGKVGSSATQSPVNLLSDQNVNDTLSRIDAIGAAYTRLQKLLAEMGDRGKAPRTAMEMAFGGNYNKYGGSYEQQMSVFRDTLARIRKEIEDMSKAGMNVTEPKRQLDALYETIAKFEALKPVNIGERLGLEHLRGYTGPQTALSDEAWASAKREAEVREVAAQAAEKHRQKLLELTIAFERQAKAEEKSRAEEEKATARQERATQAAHKRAHASAEVQRNLNREAQEVVRLRLEMLKAQAVQLNSMIKKGAGIFNASELEAYRNALRDVISQITTLKGVMANIGSFTGRNGTGLMSFGNGTNYAPLIAHGQHALEASRAVDTLTASEKRFVDSLTGASSALRAHGVLLGDLQAMATQYLSLWGARSFLNNIIETGGLLEQQRLSIGAILGSMDKAEVVFGKIKNLAIQSPFGVVELDKMSKQLTAYGFQYEELFEWTKRLADISAATGTEVSRLALALGHVRAEGALSGYTLRQFAMGNIPMLQKLSENLGISAREVRERTKKKQIGYDEVKKVLEDLTNEGGMFYNAQEVMSQALNAKFKNLRDAFDIMYGEIAESGVGDVLKGIAEALTAGAKEWKRFGTDILWVASAFGIAKLASLSYTKGMTLMRHELGILAVNTKAFTAQQIESLVASGKISRAQLLQAVATRRLTVEQASLAASTLRITEADLQQVAATGTVSKALYGNAIATSRLSMAELRHIATMRQSMGIGGAYRGFLTSLMIGFKGVGSAIKVASAALRTFLPFLAIGAIVDFFSRWSQQKEDAKSNAEELSSAVFAGAANMQSLFESMKKNGTDDYATSIKSMKEALRNIGAYESIKKDVEASQEAAKQYDILYEKVKQLAEGYEGAKASVEAYLEQAGKVGGGMFTDNMDKDLSQFGQSFIDKKVAEEGAKKFSDIYKKEFIKALKAQGKWVEKEMAGKTWQELFFKLDYRDVFWINLQKTGTIFDGTATEIEKNRYNEAAEALKNYSDALREFYSDRKEVEEQMPQYAEYIKSSAREYAKYILGGLDDDMSNWSDSDFSVFVDGLYNALKNLKIPEELKDDVMEMLLQTFPEEIRVKIRAIIDQKGEKAKLEGWHKDIQDYFDKNKINLSISADDSIQDVEKKLQDLRKKMKEKMESSAKILLHFKLKPTLDFDIKKWIASNPFFKTPIGKIVANMIEQTFKDWKSSKEEIDRIDQAHKDTGLSVISDKDAKKNKKKNKGSGRTEDKKLKAARARLDLLKKVLAEYKKYTADGRYTRDAAIGIIDTMFGNLNRNQIANIIDNYVSEIDKVRNSLKGTTEERKRFLAEADKTKLDTIFDREAEAMRRNVEAMKDYVDKMKAQWDKYHKIFEATGDKTTAYQLAFAEGYMFDDTTRAMRERLENLGNERNVRWDDSSQFSWLLDEEDAKKLFYKDGVLQQDMLNLYLEIQKLVKSNWDKTLLGWAEAYKKNATYAERLAVANKKIEEARANLASAPKEAKGLATAALNQAIKERDKISFEQFENSLGYLRFFASILTMTGDEAERMGNIIKNRLTTEFAKGNINAREYAKRMKDVNTQIEKSRTSQRGGFMSFLSGGTKGYLQHLEDKFNDAAIRLEKAQEDLKQAQEDYDNAIADDDLDEIKAAAARKLAAEQELKEARERLGITEKTLGVLSDISFAIAAMQGYIEGWEKIASSLSDLYDALGDEGNAAHWSDVADEFKAVGSIFTPIQNLLQNAMSGNVTGIVSSVLSAPVEMFTGPIAAFARLHDKALQREIEASQQRQKEMENLTKNLERALERTLGGVYYMNVAAEDLLKIREARGRITPWKTLPGGYEIPPVFGNNYLRRYGSLKEVQEVRDAYDKAMETGEYYDVQRALLFAKQDELRRQLKAEEDKKKTDAGAVEDYKQAIREMDDEIKNFALDMADTLYSIDIKSWASQLGDALFDAWQKGEDGAEAFKKKATEIITDLAKSITATKLIEKALEPLSNIVVEEMDRTSGKLDEQSLFRIAEAMAVIGTTLPDAYNTLMDGLDLGLQRAGLDSMKDAGNDSSSMSAGIKSITENTADLIASYLNAIRADVSVNRGTLQQILFALQNQQQMPVLAEAQLQRLQELVSLAQQRTILVGEIRDILHGNVNGANQFRIA